MSQYFILATNLRLNSYIVFLFISLLFEGVYPHRVGTPNGDLFWAPRWSSGFAGKQCFFCLTMLLISLGKNGPLKSFLGCMIVAFSFLLLYECVFSVPLFFRNLKNLCF